MHDWANLEARKLERARHLKESERYLPPEPADAPPPPPAPSRADPRAGFSLARLFSRLVSQR